MLELYSSAVLRIVNDSGGTITGVPMYVHVPDPIAVSTGINLWTSGIGVINPSGFITGLGPYGGVNMLVQYPESGIFGSDGTIFDTPLSLSIRGK